MGAGHAGSDFDAQIGTNSLPDGGEGEYVETFNPYSIVNLVFGHLVSHGLHPVLGESGDPGPPARALLLALGIEPAAEGNREIVRDIRAHLAELRAAVLEDR